MFVRIVFLCVQQKVALSVLLVFIKSHDKTYWKQYEYCSQRFVQLLTGFGHRTGSWVMRCSRPGVMIDGVVDKLVAGSLYLRLCVSVRVCACGCICVHCNACVCGCVSEWLHM